MNKFYKQRKKFIEKAFIALNESLDRDIKKQVTNKMLAEKEKIKKLPWDITRPLTINDKFISGYIGGKNIEFVFNESGDFSTKIDGAFATFDSIQYLRKNLPSDNNLIKDLHAFLEDEEKDKNFMKIKQYDDYDDDDDEKADKKDALDEADTFLSKFDLHKLSTQAKLELIEYIIDSIQNNVKKDEFDDIMNKIYDLLDDYYVNKDEDEDDKVIKSKESSKDEETEEDEEAEDENEGDETEEDEEAEDENEE